MNFRRVDLRVWIMFGIFCLTVFTVIAIRLWQETGGFVTTSAVYKYPPQVYYLGYTIGCSLLLLVFAEKSKRHIKGEHRVVTFIASSTLWLYLWHILGLQIAQRLTSNEYARIGIVILFSVAIVSIQKFIISAIEKRIGKNWVLSLFKG